MASLSVQTFAGTVPKTSPRLLESGQAQVAQNCQLQRGHLEPLKALGSAQALAGQTVFKLADRWLEFTKTVDVAKSFVFAENKRFMWTGDEYPKVSDLTIWPGSKRLGVPAPTVAPSVEFIDNPDYTPPESTNEDGDPNAPDEEDIEVIRSCAYVYTAINEWGEESAPSEPSPVVDVRASKLARVINMHRPEKTGVTVPKFRIYRTVSGTSGSAYQFVAEIDSTLSNYTDEQEDADLGEICATVGYTPPPDDLAGLFSASNMLFGHRKNEVWVSEASIPYAWPEAYRINVEDDVVGIGGFGSTMVICTATRPYVVTGINPDALTTAKAQFDMPCLSRQSIVSTEGAVVYASTDGLVAVAGASSFTNLTKDLFSKEQWAALGPANIIGVYYDARYYAFSKGTGKGVVLDFNRQDVATFDLGGVAVASVRYVPDEDKLYLHDGAQLYVWEGSSLPLAYTWRSKQYFSREPISMTCAMASLGDQIVSISSVSIGGESVTPSGSVSVGSVTLRYFMDGVQTHEWPVVSNAIFRLPAVNAGQVFEVEVTGTAPVFEIGLATSTQELTGGASS